LSSKAKLVIVVAALTYLGNKIHRDSRFRARLVRLWQKKVVPTCKIVWRWLGQRRRMIMGALGPGAGVASTGVASARRNASTSNLSTSSSSQHLENVHPNLIPSGTGEEEEQVADIKKKSKKVAPFNNKTWPKETLSKEDKGTDKELTDFFSGLDVDKVNEENKVPSAFYCPITHEVMTDPVIAADGHTYERGAIKRWLTTHNTSPTTNLKLLHRHVIPNHSLRSAIREFESKEANH